jgi:hypothetical protein
MNSREGWESVGTAEEQPPLLLSRCLSYDEMKLSALLSVSGYTECVNDGARTNRGLVCTDGVEQQAVIIGEDTTFFVLIAPHAELDHSLCHTLTNRNLINFGKTILIT